MASKCSANVPESADEYIRRNDSPKKFLAGRNVLRGDGFGKSRERRSRGDGGKKQSRQEPCVRFSHCYQCSGLTEGSRNHQGLQVRGWRLEVRGSRLDERAHRNPNLPEQYQVQGSRVMSLTSADSVKHG